MLTGHGHYNNNHISWGKVYIHFGLNLINDS